MTSSVRGNTPPPSPSVRYRRAEFIFPSMTSFANTFAFLGMRFYFDGTLPAASESPYLLVAGLLFSLLSTELASSLGILGDLLLLIFDLVFAVLAPGEQ